jgi:uncharacterized protein YabN with tetrapyrrole methylase and pyrophosphatase domain
MANVYKNIQAIITSSASDDPMYTVPDATTSIVKTIKLYNTHGSNLVVDVKVYDATNTTDYEYETITVNTLDSVDLLTFNNILILESGDIIKMQTPTGDKIKMTASVLQISR